MVSDRWMIIFGLGDCFTQLPRLFLLLLSGCPEGINQLNQDFRQCSVFGLAE